MLEEAHYYPYGLKIAGISSHAGNKLSNRYGYQGSVSEEESETALDEFELRRYDPQTGRWTGADPYDQFASPYTGMGNDPVNGIDPSGGDIFGIFGTSGFLDHAFSGLEGAVVGAGISAITHDGHLARDVELGFGAGVGLSFVDENTLNWIGDKTEWIGNRVGKIFKGNEWLPFYKVDLIKYAISNGINPTENNLGNLFEDIFEKYAKEELYPKDALELARFRRSDRVWTDAGIRNSKPDFVADDFYDISAVFWRTEMKRVSEGSAWEIKQNNGKGIYLSSNDGQIRGHILNLAAKHAVDIATGNYNPMLTLITTYDVTYSKSTLLFATINKVQYTHSRSKYRIVRGQYKFKFVNYGDKDW